MMQLHLKNKICYSLLIFSYEGQVILFYLFFNINLFILNMEKYEQPVSKIKSND